MKLKIGDKAPEFTLRASDTKEVSLSDYKGKRVLVLFFPLAFTGTCTEELCLVRDNMSVYERLGCQVLGISVDSPFVLAKYKEEQTLNFPLLSDFNKEVSRAYGALYEDFILDMKGVSKRSVFLIDRNDIIRHVEVLENAADLPNFAALKDTLTRIKQ